MYKFTCLTSFFTWTHFTDKDTEVRSNFLEHLLYFLSLYVQEYRGQILYFITTCPGTSNQGRNGRDFALGQALRMSLELPMQSCLALSVLLSGLPLLLPYEPWSFLSLYAASSCVISFPHSSSVKSSFPSSGSVSLLPLSFAGCSSSSQPCCALWYSGSR